MNYWKWNFEKLFFTNLYKYCSDKLYNFFNFFYQFHSSSANDLLHNNIVPDSDAV